MRQYVRPRGKRGVSCKPAKCVVDVLSKGLRGWVKCFPLFYKYLFPFSLMEHKRTYAPSHQTTYAHPPDYTVRSTCGSSNVRVGRKQSAELHISKPQNLGNQSRRLVQSQTASGTKCMPAIHPPLACCSTSKGKHQRSVLT